VSLPILSAKQTIKSFVNYGNGQKEGILIKEQIGLKRNISEK